ncbi:hypothetical protein D3C87_1232140 [compost metagenome]
MSSEKHVCLFTTTDQDKTQAQEAFAEIQHWTKSLNVYRHEVQVPLFTFVFSIQSVETDTLRKMRRCLCVSTYSDLLQF